MKIFIVEDEAIAAERLKRMLASVEPEAEIVGICTGVETSVKWLKTNPSPELIFMDIEIADGRSFEIFKHISISSPVIFITSYDEFAINAIKLNALDYLLKPIDKDELITAIKKAKALLANGSASKPDYNALYQTAAHGERPKKIAITDINGIRFINTELIIRLKADSNYTTIYINNGENIVSSKTLKEYEELLSSMGFFRVHNTHLINLAQVDKYIKGIGGTVIMSDGAAIEVSRQKKKELLEALSLNQ